MVVPGSMPKIIRSDFNSLNYKFLHSQNVFLIKFALSYKATHFSSGKRTNTAALNIPT